MISSIDQNRLPCGNDPAERIYMRTGTIDLPSAPSIPLGLNIKEQKAPLVKGDHIHATSYWNSVDTTDCNGRDIRGRYHIYTNTANAVPATNCVPGSSISTEDVTFGFNAAAFVSPAPKEHALPAGKPVDWDFLTQMADTKALSRVNQSLVNLPMLYKERVETLSMASNKVGQLVDIIRDIQKRDLSRWRKAKSRASKRRVAKVIAGEHLEFIFGVLPLIGEIEGAMELYERPRLEFIRVNGTQTLALPSVVWERNKSVNYTARGISAISGTTDDTVGKIITRGTVKPVISVRTALRFDISSQMLMDLRKLGFEPISTLQDMVPLSFVLSWVSNFGSWVRTITPHTDLKFVTGSRNRRQVSRANASLLFSPQRPGTSSGWTREWIEHPYGSCGEVNLTKTQNVRTVVDVVPKPSFHFYNNFSLFSVTAGISLMIQRKLKLPLRLIKQKPFRYRGPKPRNLPPIRYRKP